MRMATTTYRVMDRHRSYYEVEMDDPISCACGWSGTVFDGFEPYDELYDVRCQECNRMLLIVSYPTIEETKEAAAAGNRRAIKGLPFALERERFLAKLEAYRLHSPDQLPELEATPSRSSGTSRARSALATSNGR
jgi:hypothetical protein